jgi:hypothetical protein
MAVTYSSSAMPAVNIPRASVWGVQTAFASYSGVFSCSASDIIEMLRLPRNAIVDQVRVGGAILGTVGVVSVGDDAANTAAAHTRYNAALSLSNVAATATMPAGQFAYSLSDDDRDVTILLMGVANTSVSGSASVWCQVFYHMP